jgi:LDH2 family malate/lactate/ureidoglycolate dehydrogenase
MAFVTVRNSNHFGIAGYYTKMACDSGMMAISTTNSESIAVHTNSREAILGSNPIAFAMPAEPIPFWFDAATTVIPKGKLEVYNKEDKKLEDGWAMDENGSVCYDAEHALSCIDNKLGGGILTLGGIGETNGGHKGYGYSMMCEILCAITSCGLTSNHHVRKKGTGAGTCHSFIVIDPKIFGDAEALKKNLSVFLEELRTAKRADENVPIYTHGEKEQISYNERMRDGVMVNISTVKEMLDICEFLGMDSKKYIPEGIDISSAKRSSYDNIYK